MKTEKVKLSQVKVNTANPRTIREAKLNLLVQRMLVFPKMIAIRPIVVDNKMVVLGGNMRVTALNRIAGMTFEQLATIMGKTKKYQKWSQRWRERILSQWQDWLENPTVDIVEATELTEEEKKEFIIADNASFGEWDYDKLANEWEAEDLNSWKRRRKFGAYRSKYAKAKRCQGRTGTALRCQGSARTGRHLRRQ